MSSESRFLELVERGVVKVYPDGSFWRMVGCSPKRRRSWRQINPRLDARGEPRVDIKVGGRAYGAPAHRVAWLVAHSPANLNGLDIEFVDGDKLNLAASNLRTVPLIYQRRRVGKIKEGRRRHGGKLTPAKVRRIRECLANGESQGSLSRHYGVSVSTIGKIKHAKLWMSLE